MSVARVTELSATSETGFEEAINEAVARATKTLRTNLSKFSACSYTSLLVILAIRARPDEEGDHIGAGTE